MINFTQQSSWQTTVSVHKHSLMIQTDIYETSELIRHNNDNNKTVSYLQIYKTVQIASRDDELYNDSL